MIIVHIAEYASGGIATYLKNVISFQLKEKNIDKVILINSKCSSESIEFDSPKFVHVVYGYKRGVKGILKLLNLRKQIESWNPDIVHFHSSFAGIVRFDYLFKSPKYKVVYCAHGWSFTQKNKGRINKFIYSKVEFLLSRKTDLIINISNDEMRKAINEGLPSDKMKVIYNSIPNESEKFDVENPFLKSTKNLLFIGRFDEQKGLDFLLNNVDFKSKNVSLAVIGDSVLGDTSFENLDDSYVNFLGWKNNKYIDSYIELCDAVIIPSRWEGFGMVALEAMKNKRMVLCSDVGGLSEIVEQGKTGFKFKPESKIEINNQINKFSQMTKKEIKRFGENGYSKFITKYNNDDLCNELQNSYQKLIL